MRGAAESLHMTPSAVSQHIANLEKTHSVKLLNRNPRRVTPTSAGRILGTYCRQLQHSLADTEKALETIKTEAKGILNINLLSGVSSSIWMHHFLRRLRREYPEIRPRLIFSDEVADVFGSDVDIALRGVYGEITTPNVVARKLATWSYELIATPKYLSTVGIPETPDDLYKLCWLSRTPLHFTLTNQSQKVDVSIEDYWYVNQMITVNALTLGGVGASMVVRPEVEHYFPNGRLQAILPDWQKPTINIYAVTPHRVQTAKLAVAMRLLQECFADSSSTPSI